MSIPYSTAVMFGMACAVIGLVLLVAFLADEVIRLRSYLNNDLEDDHAKCIAHIADVTSKRFVAVALRDLAERYDSVEERSTIAQIKRVEWTLDGPPLPVLWMLHHADLLDPQKDEG
jgi:hypothetical protein